MSIDQLDLARLIHRSREGDALAVEDLVRTHEAAIYRLALSMLDDPAEADEATQDTFIAAVQRLHQYRGEAAFTTWLYAIALNVCRRRLRRRQMRQRLPALLQRLIGADTAPPPEQLAIAHETDAAIWQAVKALDYKLREVIVLRYFNELRQVEIAQVLGVTDRTVRTRLHAAHEQLRLQLRETLE